MQEDLNPYTSPRLDGNPSVVSDDRSQAMRWVSTWLRRASWGVLSTVIGMLATGICLAIDQALSPIGSYLEFPLFALALFVGAISGLFTCVAYGCLGFAPFVTAPRWLVVIAIVSHWFCVAIPIANLESFPALFASGVVGITSAFVMTDYLRHIAKSIDDENLKRRADNMTMAVASTVGLVVVCFFLLPLIFPSLNLLPLDQWNGFFILIVVSILLGFIPLTLYLRLLRDLATSIDDLLQSPAEDDKIPS